MTSVTDTDHRYDEPALSATQKAWVARQVASFIQDAALRAIINGDVPLVAPADAKPVDPVEHAARCKQVADERQAAHDAILARRETIIVGAENGEAVRVPRAAFEEMSERERLALVRRHSPSSVRRPLRARLVRSRGRTRRATRRRRTARVGVTRGSPRRRSADDPEPPLARLVRALARLLWGAR